VTRRPSCCRCCGSWVSASCPTHRSGTASSPDRSARLRTWPTTIGARRKPRFAAGNFEKNLLIVDEVTAVASALGATSAQVALAWLLAQGDDIAPIPGTMRVSRVEENIAADRVELSAEQIERLNDLTPASGKRHDERTWPPSRPDPKATRATDSPFGSRNEKTMRFAGLLQSG
jgi:Aldo/keto reductase family